MKKEAILYEKGIKENRVKCTCCNHFCQIPPGKTGICGIRKNENGKLYLLTWGKALGVNIDPIEKKPLFHVLPGTKVFSFGTAGCNFHCFFCQNWQMSQIKEKTDGINIKNSPYIYTNQLEKIGTDLLPEQAIKTALYYKCSGLAYTYNEPTVFAEYAYDCAILTRNKEEAQRIKNLTNTKNQTINANLLNIFVSNGYESKETLDLFNGYLDAINIDLKGFSEEFYQKICGGKLQPVLDNIKNIYNNYNIFLEITTLIIPGENDSDSQLNKIAEFIASVSPNIPWHISAFHPDWKMLNKPFTPLKTLEKAYKIGKKKGLKYIYIGNISVPEYETTYCPSCGKKIIERSGTVGENVKDYTNLTGICPYCEEKIHGIWIEDGKIIVRK